MTSAAVNRATLQRFVPMDSLSEHSLDRLLRHVRSTTLRSGDSVWKQGQHGSWAVYLLSGAVRIEDRSGEARTVEAGSSAARANLAQAWPPADNATATTESSLLWVDRGVLDALLTHEESAGYVVEEIRPGDTGTEEDDWTVGMLRTEAGVLAHIPSANVFGLFQRFEPVSASAGTDIVVQDEEADYFYVVKSGRAEVLRYDDAGRAERLAVKEPGDVFGEESLMGATVHNATVRMVSDGELMRLTRPDFEELLKKPLLREIDYETALSQVRAGQAAWVDVRLNDEYCQASTSVCAARVIRRRHPPPRIPDNPYEPLGWEEGTRAPARSPARAATHSCARPARSFSWPPPARPTAPTAAIPGTSPPSSDAALPGCEAVGPFLYAASVSVPAR